MNGSSLTQDRLASLDYAVEKKIAKGLPVYEGRTTQSLNLGVSIA